MRYVLWAFLCFIQRFVLVGIIWVLEALIALRQKTNICLYSLDINFSLCFPSTVLWGRRQDVLCKCLCRYVVSIYRGPVKAICAYVLEVVQRWGLLFNKYFTLTTRDQVRSVDASINLQTETSHMVWDLHTDCECMQTHVQYIQCWCTTFYPVRAYSIVNYCRYNHLLTNSKQ